MKYPYAGRISRLKASEIRELLKITEFPEIISFAGGLPAPELFPVDELVDVSARVLREEGRSALQYTTTEGYLPLREWIAARVNQTRGTSFEADDILLTNGSQQALDLSGKVFLDEGDTVLCESPTYLAAITAFRAYGCRFAEVPTDADGMRMDALAELLDTEKHVKLIYVVPDFQNPTGRMWSRERRETLCRLAEAHGVVVLEDDPYGELRFEGERLPSVKSYDRTAAYFIPGRSRRYSAPATDSAGSRATGKPSASTCSSSRGPTCSVTRWPSGS
jgi:2-aminoadipate transaminase